MFSCVGYLSWYFWAESLWDSGAYILPPHLWDFTRHVVFVVKLVAFIYLFNVFWLVLIWVYLKLVFGFTRNVLISSFFGLFCGYFYQCAASMNVSVGAFSDPEGLEGLAHFLGMSSFLKNGSFFMWLHCVSCFALYLALILSQKSCFTILATVGGWLSGLSSSHVPT